ncbi:MAG: hypothetical protein ACRDIA_04180 [Actinomycetota bacterium]
MAFALIIAAAGESRGSEMSSPPPDSQGSDPHSGSGSGEPGQPGQPGGGSDGSSGTSGSGPTTTLSSPDPDPQPATRKRTTKKPGDPGGPFVEEAPEAPSPTVNLAAGPPPPDQGSGAPPDAVPASDEKPKRKGPLDALAALLGFGGAATAATARKPPNPCLRLQSEFDKVMGQIAAHRNFLRAQMATARKDDPTGVKVEELEAQLTALDSGEGHLNDQARALADKMTQAGCNDGGN